MFFPQGPVFFAAGVRRAGKEKVQGRGTQPPRVSAQLSPAELVGWVTGKDADSALEKYLAERNVTDPQEVKRLYAMRDRPRRLEHDRLLRGAA
jgi:hypothetical protein